VGMTIISTNPEVHNWDCGVQADIVKHPLVFCMEESEWRGGQPPCALCHSRWSGYRLDTKIGEIVCRACGWAWAAGYVYGKNEP
jgi:hypothetical protein